MDAENNDVPRVTRARTRRMSTDVRPLTPLVDATTERASPRPLRRTRLNSATTELKTPTRTTRLSVARGETPEPETASVKRATRTPGKSVRKQLTLKEEANEEPQATQTKMEVVQESKETDDVANTSNDSTAATVEDKPERPSSVGPITRSMSKTPPSAGRTSNNTTPTQLNVNISKEEKHEQTTNYTTPTRKQAAKQQTLNELTPTSDKNSSLSKVKLLFEKSESSAKKTNIEDVNESNSNDKSIVANEKLAKSQRSPDPTEIVENLNQRAEFSSTVQETASTTEVVKSSLSKEVDVIENKPESLSSSPQKSQISDKKNKSIVVIDESNVSTTQLEETSTNIAKTQSNVVDLDQSIVALNETNTNDKDSSVEEHEEPSLGVLKMQIDESGELRNNNNDASLITEADEPNSAILDEQINMSPTQGSKVIKNSLLANFTPKTKPRTESLKKSVDFYSNNDSDDVPKTIFPKTPSRSNVQHVDLNFLKADVKSETPIKPKTLHGRISSTPLADATSVSGQPPAQVDTIKPLAELEGIKAEVKINKEKLPRRLVSEDEEEDEDEESDYDQAECEFVDSEAVAVENYQSGDSMDSSVRREIEENEIHEAGESLGSQDTTDEHSEDSDDEKLSCIVSDNDEEIETLLDFSDEISLESDANDRKKRKRIIVHDTTDDEDDNDQQNEGNDEFKKELSKNDTDSEVEEVLSSTDEKQHEQSVEYTNFIMEVSDSDENPSKNSDDVLKDTELPYNKSISKPVEEIILESVPTEEVVIREDLLKSSSSVISSNNDKSVHEDDGLKLVADPPKESAPQEQETSENKEFLTDPASRDLSSTNSTDEEMEMLQEPVLKEKRNSKSLLFHNKQTREEEEPLLDELASVDLSHLQKMFNPLQKSRRQTLFSQDREMSIHESKTKLKRRSEVLSSDVQPSQSFIETLVEQKSKRKRLSKSFCGASDDLGASAIDESVQVKKAKTTADDEPSTSGSDKHEPAPAMDEDATDVAAKEVTPPKEQDNNNQVKSRDFYMEYCDTILQAANEAKLKQKKVRIAAGKTSKKQPSAVVAAPVTNEVLDKPEKLKKNLKRLKVTKKAVKHAVQLLLPDTVSRSLSRKLSPQPEPVKIGKAKQNPKPKTKHVSPVKSSDEENHHAVKKFIKNSAGFVIMSDVEDPVEVETIRTRSGFVKVEPCTPKQKYFREVPSTPQNFNGFQELAGSPSLKNKTATGTKERVGQNRTSATESALRFKRQIFGRRAK